MKPENRTCGNHFATAQILALGVALLLCVHSTLTHAQPKLTLTTRPPETQALKTSRDAALRASTYAGRAIVPPRPGFVGQAVTVYFVATLVHPLGDDTQVGLVAPVYALEGASTIEVYAEGKWQAVDRVFSDADSGLVLLSTPNDAKERKPLTFQPLSEVFSLGWDRRIYGALRENDKTTIVLGMYGEQGKDALAWYTEITPWMQLGSPSVTQWGELVGFCALHRADSPGKCWLLGEASFKLFSQRWTDPDKRGGGFEVKRVNIELRTP